MYVSTLGQTQQYQTQQTRVVYGMPRPMYYAPGLTFSRGTDSGVPGQLYTTQITSADIEKEVYKDLPQETIKEKEVTGTEPQKLIKLQSGLEVPAYIMQRDLARKQAKIREEEAALIGEPLQKYHKIGMFASKKPAQASLIALALGYICGQLVYSFKH